MHLLICLYIREKGLLMAKTPTIELMLHDDVQKLLDVFAVAMKIRIVLYNPDGKIIRSDRQQRNSDYCQLIQNGLFPGACALLDSTKQLECLKRKTLICYQCHAGLKEALAPVFVDTRLVGYVMIGQFRDISKVPSNVINRCGKQFTSREVKRCFLKLPYVATERIEGILGMFTMLVDYIVARELVGLRGDWILEKVHQYLDRHLTEKVKVQDVARLTGRSVSSLSHVLRNKHGLTFKQMLIRKRLDRADELMKSHPEMSLGEIAAQSGFDDRFYFSRIYRKHRGMTPSQSRSPLSGHTVNATLLPDNSPEWMTCSKPEMASVSQASL
jgi:AraC-like DNA-binding protein/ligand-binding sensor protein